MAFCTAACILGFVGVATYPSIDLVEVESDNTALEFALDQVMHSSLPTPPIIDSIVAW